MNHSSATIITTSDLFSLKICFFWFRNELFRKPPSKSSNMNVYTKPQFVYSEIIRFKASHPGYDVGGGPGQPGSDIFICWHFLLEDCFIHYSLALKRTYDGPKPPELIYQTVYTLSRDFRLHSRGRFISLQAIQT
jgi:hypothetical protein